MAALQDKFKMIMEHDGLWTAMRWLNERVPYRFTAIFAFCGNTLRNVCLIDKENPAITGCNEQPISDSYCTYIHSSGRKFSVEGSLLDARVAGHPKRESYQCYYGIPLIGANGALLGTVCHFDKEPIPVTEDVVSALDDLAPVIAEAAFDR